MQNLDSRLNSFTAITKPKSKIKPSWPLSSSKYPNLNPDSLSKAGFYHTPGESEDSLDNCKCFLCDVELGGWDNQDDPFEEHSRRGNCAWADMVCTVKIEKRKRDQSDGEYITTYPTSESLPQSIESAVVREQTYKKWWPHKQKSGWLPTVKNLARAGFVYAPSTNSKDGAMCPYCEYAVEGWEAIDDPWELHQRKVPDCHFFRAQLEGGPSEEKVTKAPAKNKKTEVAKRSKRGTTAAPSVVSEAEEKPSQATELPSEAESIALSQSATTKKKATKPRATTTRRKTTARGKKKANTVELEEEPEIVEVADDTITSISQTQLPTAVPEEEEEVQAKKGKAKKASKAKPRATTAEGKGKKKVEEAQTEEEDEPLLLGSEVEPDTENEPEAEVESIPQTRLRQSSKPASLAAPTTSQNQSKSSKHSKSSSTSKPLPPIPSPSPIHSPQSQPPSRPLSQLDRFTNIPPSSPIPPTEYFSPKPKSLLRTTNLTPKQPSSNKPLPREVLESSLTRGAVEARKVIEDLISTPISSIPTPSKTSNKANDEQGIIKDKEGEEEGIIKLSEEEKSMTLEDLIRLEMKKRFQEMQKEGEDMIEKWEERAKSERKRIETI